MADELKSAEVEITLLGEMDTLKCTLGAATAISNHFGGFGRAFERVQALDLDACTRIIRWGTGIEGEAMKAQAGKVFVTGLANLTGPLAEYLGLLISGGRRMGADASGEAKRGNAALN